MMKKLLALAIAVTGLFIFVGCSEDTDEFKSRILDLEETISNLELNITELETQLYQSEIQDYQLCEESEGISSCDVDYNLFAGIIFEEIGFSRIGLRYFEDDDELLQVLGRSNDHLSFGYTYFDFNSPPWFNSLPREEDDEFSKVAFFYTINSTVISSDGVETFGHDLKVVIEYDDLLHYAYFFSGIGIVRAVIPYRHRRDPELRFEELEPALLVVIDAHLTRSDIAYLVTFDGYDIEILRMELGEIYIPCLGC